MSFSVAWSIIAIDKFTQVANQIKAAADKMGEQFEKLNKKVEKANKTVDKSANSLNRLSEAQNRVNRIFAIGSAIMGGVALKTSSDIEEAFNQTQAVLQLSAKDFDLMKKKARDLSLSMNVPIKEVAIAMENFGAITEEEISKVKHAITFSKAMGKPMQDVVSDLYDTSTALKLVGQDFGDFTDKLSYISTISNKVDTSVIARAFGRGASVLLRQSDDLNSMLGIIVGLGEAGIETTGITRALIKAQTALLRPSKNLKTTLDQMQKSVGKSLYTQEGKLKKWVDIAEIIEEAREKIIPKSGQTKAQAFEEFLLQLFGPQGANIIKSINEQIKEITKTTNELSSSASGMTKKMAAIKDQGLAAEIRHLGTAFQGLFEIIFDDKLKGALADIIRSIRQMVGAFINFLNENPRLKSFVQTITILLGVVLPLGAAFLALLGTLKLITAISLVGTFGLWGFAIAGLVASIKYLVENWDKLNNVITNFTSKSRVTTFLKDATFGIGQKTFEASSWAAMQVRKFFGKEYGPQAHEMQKSSMFQINNTQAPLRNELSLDINIKDRDNFVESVKTKSSNLPGFNLGSNIVTIGR